MQYSSKFNQQTSQHINIALSKKNVFNKINIYKFSNHQTNHQTTKRHFIKKQHIINIAQSIFLGLPLWPFCFSSSTALGGSTAVQALSAASGASGGATASRRTRPAPKAWPQGLWGSVNQSWLVEPVVGWLKSIETKKEIENWVDWWNGAKQLGEPDKYENQWT